MLTLRVLPILHASLVLMGQLFARLVPLAALGFLPVVVTVWQSLEAPGSAPSLALIVLQRLAEYLLLAAIAQLVIDRHRQRRLRLQRAVRRALGALSPLVAIAVVSETAQLLGQLHPLAMVIPVVAAAVLLPAIPMAMAEEVHGPHVLMESVELTRGYRWPLLGLVLLPPMLLLLPMSAMGQFVTEDSTLAFGLMLALQALLILFMGIAAAQTYLALRARKPRLWGHGA